MSVLAILLPALFSFSLIPAAYADAIPYVICTGLPGCGAPPSDVLSNATLPGIASILITLVSGGSVISIIVTGIQLVLHYGDESKVAKARNGVIYALGGLGLALAAASIVQYIASEPALQGAADNYLVYVMQAAVSLILTFFNTLLGITIVYAGIRIVLAQGKSDEFTKGLNMLKFGIAGAVLVNISRLLVQALLRIGF